MVGPVEDSERVLFGEEGYSLVLETTLINQIIHLKHIFLADLILLTQPLAELRQYPYALQQIVRVLVVRVLVPRVLGQVGVVAVGAFDAGAEVLDLLVFVLALLPILVPLLQSVLDLHVHHLDLLL